MNKKIYLIGSLRNPKIPVIGNRLRQEGYDVFDDWFAGGEHADDEWRDYEQSRGRSYQEALDGFAAEHTFNFDMEHLGASDIGILVAPAGRSGHLELGWMIGKGKPSYVLLDAAFGDGRWDVMYKLADGVYTSVDLLIQALKGWEV